MAIFNPSFRCGLSRKSAFLFKLWPETNLQNHKKNHLESDLKAMKVNTTVLVLSPNEAVKNPYIASMGVYVFKLNILLKLLRFRYPTANDFGLEIILASTKECNIEHSIVGIRSHLKSGVELKDTMMIGVDYYETEAEIATILAEGKVPSGIGKNTKIRNCIINKNARIGKNVMISNTDNVQGADRPSQSFYICTGIIVILKKLNNP